MWQKLDEYVSVTAPDTTFLPPFDLDTCYANAQVLGMPNCYSIVYNPQEFNGGFYDVPNAVQYTRNVVPKPYTYDSAIEVQNHWVYQ
jgi:hypothetical protein